MSLKDNAIAHICAQNPTMAEDIRANFKVISDTAARLHTLSRFSTGSPDEHAPEDYEKMLEMLRDDCWKMADHVDAIKTNIEVAATIVEYQTQLSLEHLQTAK